MKYDVDVDSGSPHFAHLSEVNEWTDEPLTKESLPFKTTYIIQAPEGATVATIKCDDTWNGEVREFCPVVGGELYYLGDLCYVIHDRWNQFLDATDFGDDFDVRLRTGGDGGFTFTVEFS